jgi:hypothetical protein
LAGVSAGSRAIGAGEIVAVGGSPRSEAGNWIERQRGQLNERFDLVWAGDARIDAGCGVGFDQRGRAVRLA